MSIDVEKLARVVQKLAGEVQALKGGFEERAADVEEDVENRLNNFALGLYDKILEPRFAVLDAQEQQLKRLQGENEKLRADVAYLQALLAGHEVALIGITGQPTEPVFPKATPEKE